MRFSNTANNKKRLKINRLAAAVGIATLALAGCVSTPDQTASTAPNPADTPTTRSHTTDHAPRSQPQRVKRGGLGDLTGIFSSSDDEVDEPTPYALDGSAWERLRTGFKLDHSVRHPLIDNELKFYRSHPGFVYRASERASRYFHYVLSEVEQRGMPTELALLPMVESAYDPFAYSRSGASGMWQFVPLTGKHFGLKNTYWYDGRKDVVASTDAALKYLQYLHNKFKGDWLLAVAAYNFGEGSIDRAIARNRQLGRPTDFWSLPLREETRTYVPKLLALSKIMDAPARYGINLHPIPNQAYFAAVDTRGPLDLNRAASLAGVDVKELYLLNPGFNHGATDPSGPHRLLLPVAAAERFSRQLAQVPAVERAPSQRHVVAKGETLNGIARRYGTDVGSLAAHNALGGHMIKPGQSLLIPGRGSAPASTVASAPFSSRQVIHTVAPGESMWRIEQRYGVSKDQIQRWNGMGPNDYLKAGQRLSLWLPNSRQPVQVAAAAPAQGKPASQDASKAVGYTVQSGDSLVRIASRFKVQVNDIVRWNQVSPNSLLQPGQKLTLYVSSAGGIN